jgi:hypothetical protein
LPRVQADEISVAEAAKEMSISPRSLKRYMEENWVDRET